MLLLAAQPLQAWGLWERKIQVTAMVMATHLAFRFSGLLLRSSAFAHICPARYPQSLSSDTRPWQLLVPKTLFFSLAIL